MNDFTKKELETMQANLPYIDGESCELSNKIQVMINNYCEHEWESFKNENGYFIGRCKKCGESNDNPIHFS